MSRIIIQKDIEIPMRDGCVLKGDLYRPEGPARLPVLLNRTPYDKSFLPITLNTLDVVRAARAGYNVGGAGLPRIVCLAGYFSLFP